MNKLIIILLVVGAVGLMWHRQHRANIQADAPKPAHAALTQMALNAEAQAKHAAHLVETDPVASYEQQQP